MSSKPLDVNMTLWPVAVVGVAVVASCAHLTHAFLGIPSFLEFGNCAKVDLKENFDPVKYTGLWFDIETVPNEYQHTKKCVTQNYTWTGERMDVATRGLSVEDKKVRQTAFMLRDKNIPNPASMLVNAEGVPEAPYQVVATDYRTFSCVYSCLDGYAGFMAEFMWVFSRTPTLPAEKVKYCYDIFDTMGVDPEKMMPVVQGQPCPYFEKLDQMLAESEQHMLKVGSAEPSVPKPVPAPTQPPTASPTQPPTTAPTTPPLPRTRENDVQDPRNVVKKDKELLKSPRHEVKESEKRIDPPPASKTVVVPSRGSSVRRAGAGGVGSSATTVLTTPLLLFTLLLWLGQNQKRNF